MPTIDSPDIDLGQIGWGMYSRFAAARPRAGGVSLAVAARRGLNYACILLWGYWPMPFDMSIPSGLENCTQAWKNLKLAHDAIWQRLFALDDAQELDLVSASGVKLGAFKAGEYKFKYGRITWSLVKAVPANGGVGATESLPKNMRDYKKWSGANTRILPTGLIGYDAWHEQGLNFLVLHETAHTLAIGMAMNNDCWKEHLDREDGITWGMGSPAWERNERFANDIALRMAEALQVKILGSARPGFDLGDHIADDGSTPPLTPADIPLHHLDPNQPPAKPTPHN